MQKYFAFWIKLPHSQYPQLRVTYPETLRNPLIHRALVIIKVADTVLPEEEMLQKSILLLNNYLEQELKDYKTTYTIDNTLMGYYTPDYVDTYNTLIKQLDDEHTIVLTLN